MKLIRHIEQIDHTLAGCAITLGNFDGVHRGHAEIISRLLQWAGRVGGPAVVFTFDPHPVRLLRPELAPPPLTWTQRKAELLQELGVDCMIAWPTDRHLLSLTYREFFQQIMLDQLQVAAMVEGPNFYFGRDREGNIDRLMQLCDESGIACEIVQPEVCDDELISSTRIRNLIHEGDVAAARTMLTRPYRIRGMVVHGAGRGHELGFPTANLDAIDTLIPAMGVYAGLASVQAELRPAAIHVGPSPTFGVVRPQVEVHVMDFADVMYGEVLEVDFLEQLRGVQQFNSIDELKTQLALDVTRAGDIGDGFLKQISDQSK